MNKFKTAIFAATMMTAATGMTAEVSGNVALGSEYFSVELTSLEARLSLVGLTSILTTVFMSVPGLQVLILVMAQNWITTLVTVVRSPKKLATT